MNWILYALSASVLWGFGYAFSERIIKNDLPTSFFVLTQGVIGVVIYLGLSLYMGTLRTGIETLQANPKLILSLVAVASSTMLGVFLIYMAILHKNASMANLIEITYPLFTMFFAWLLFRDVQINWSTALGGLLIFCGVGLIYWKS
ncbi:MAG: EamA family transporter [Alphaproteobacteria bacterium]|nr:EamA family transporter [Alphaproteobacteria bacterium]